MVNYQRSFDSKLIELKKFIHSPTAEILLVRACYYKGLSHIGSTLLYLLIELLGLPESVITTAEAFNKEILEKSYDFSLQYSNGVQASVNTLDRGLEHYYFHIFDFEIILNDRKILCHFNSRYLTTYLVGPYDYSDVKILIDTKSLTEKTGYDGSMFQATEAISKFFKTGAKPNYESVKRSFNVSLLIDAIERSYNSKSNLNLKELPWK